MTFHISSMTLNVIEDIVTVANQMPVDASPQGLLYVPTNQRPARVRPAHIILVVDSHCRYIAGYHLGPQPPSATNIKLAVLRAMTQKAKWLK